ncbi:ESF1 homolog [Aplysia californica]|uniref:ESF1 homolog n=1 Tax=Aplysia californica TaxID=6500 RepID=A0ABM0JS35_APLCA|nr:ESF1 homolog [Aplysia californica]
MDAISDDPRFAHIASDPRFKPMPKSKKKVKIDSRFQSLFTNRHFSHRMDMDKRGRPVRDPSKKNKSTMERFYEMSDTSSDSDASESEESADSKSENLHQSQSQLSGGDSGSEQCPNGDSSAPVTVKKTTKKNQNAKNKSGNQLESVVPTKEDLSKLKGKKRKKLEDSNSDGTVVLPMKKKHKAKAGMDDEDFDNADTDGEENAEDNPSDGSRESATDEEEEGDLPDSEEEEEEEDLPEYTQDFDMEETDVDHRWNELQTDAPEVSQSTRRLAVCNMDWDFVKAQDLFVLFKSFVPEGGCVNSVAIYMSEFGKERMAEEAKLGPKEMRERVENGDNGGTQKGKRRKMDEKKEKHLRKERDVVHREKLREYQLNRLKYYYAVVDCDSVRTADTVYTECDGREYQLSSVRLDLRFIPEDMTFEDEPREMFSEGQTTVDYQPSTFQSTALCQARVEVTWDETEFDRLSRRVSALQQKELESIVEENKYSDIIAPPESDSEEEGGQPEWLKSVLAQNDDDDVDDDDDEEGSEEKVMTEQKKIDLYRKLLMDKITEEEEEKQKEENDVDKVLEWQPGLKTSVEKKLQKKAKKKEESTLVNHYLEKRKEKKRKKRERKLQEMVPEDGAEAFSDDELPEGVEIDDSLKEMMEGEHRGDGQGKKKKKRKTQEVAVEDEAEDMEKAELELMLMDDAGGRHLSKPELVPNSDSMSKKKRQSKKQMAKRKKTGQEDTEHFVLDVEDKRFGALFTSHHFHIDPTAPQFKKTKNMQRLVDEQIRRKSKGGSGKRKSRDGAESPSTGAGGAAATSRSVSQSLVESLKEKMKKKKKV